MLRAQTGSILEHATTRAQSGSILEPAASATGRGTRAGTERVSIFSVQAQQAQGRVLGLGPEEQLRRREEPEAADAWGGLFTDYVVRASASKACRAPLSPKPSQPHMQRRLSRDKAVRLSGCPAAIELATPRRDKWHELAVGDAAEALQRERLSSTLADVFAKQPESRRPSSVEGPSTCEAWRRRAREVVKLKRHHSALSTEMDHVARREADAARDESPHAASKAGDGDADARAAKKEGRLHNFFHEFHEASRIPELGVTVSGEGGGGFWRPPRWQSSGVPLQREKDFADAVEAARGKRSGRGREEARKDWTSPRAAVSPRRGHCIAKLALHLQTESSDEGKGSRLPKPGEVQSARLSRPAAEALPSLTPRGQAPAAAERQPRAEEPERFARPWLDKVSGDASSSASRRYLRACEKLGVLPSVIPFVTGDSARLASSDHIMADSDLRAIMMVIRGIKHLEEIDLENSSALTSASVVPLLEKIFGSPVSDSLRRLSLKRCVQMGQGALDLVIRLLQSPDGLPKLRHLDLSGLKLAASTQVELCSAIRRHHTLASVYLEETGLGGGLHAENPVEMLLSSRALQELRIGWNCFGADQFQRMGDTLAGHKGLLSLGLANTIATTRNRGNMAAVRLSPITLLLEQLSQEASLTFLDVSMNSLDFRGALVIEDALENNRHLRQIDVSHNPLGVLGMRYMLRLLSRDSGALTSVVCDACDGGGDERGAAVVGAPWQSLSTSCPGGRYTLDLADPSHRAILRLLYKLADRLGVPPDAAFTQLSFSRGAYTHPSKKDGVWAVPKDGLLELLFDAGPILEGLARGAGPAAADSPGVLVRHMRGALGQPVCLGKVIPMLSMWKGMSAREGDQRLLLQALSRDFRLTYPQVAELRRGGRLASEVVRWLLPSLASSQSARFLSTLSVSSLNKFWQVYRLSEEYLHLNLENPTGRYALKLSSPTGYAVAHELVLLSQWEAIVAARQGRADVSHLGDGSCLRNASFEGRALPARWSTDDWPLPGGGPLTFDYVSCRRLPADAEALEEGMLKEALDAIHGSSCDARGRVAATRAISHSVICSAGQLRELFPAMLDRQACVNVVVSLFFRVTDVHHEKEFRMWFREEEIREIWQRLGHTATFPFVQPEQARFVLDLEDHDQRRAAHLLASFAAKEDRGAILQASLLSAQGLLEALEDGVPPGWATSIDKVPSSGVFTARFSLSSHGRNFPHRIGLLEQYGLAGSSSLKESEVSWQSGFAEAPTAVVQLLESFAAQHDGESGLFAEGQKEQLTVAEFEEGLCRVLGVKELTGVHKERAQALFSFLDVQQSGQLSQADWLVAEQVWAEVKRSLRELAVVLHRKWGDDLWGAWRNGEVPEDISRETWDGIVQSANYIGYDFFTFLNYKGASTFSRKRLIQAVDKIASGARPTVLSPGPEGANPAISPDDELN